MKRASVTATAAMLASAWVASQPVNAHVSSLVVAITSPSAGATVSGTIPVSADVTIVGALTVSHVDFYVDQALIGSDATPPYGVPWNTQTVSNASHTLTAVAQDIVGGRWNSDPVTVTVANPPTIASFSPGSGPIGTMVTISGSRFSGASAVHFNGKSAGFTVNSSTSITAAVPSGATTGPISVTTAAGTGTSSAHFTVIPPPTIGSFTPTSGPIATTVVISGTDFTGATAVQFNGVAAGFTVDSSTSITATVPSGATTGPISVTTPGGTATSSASFTVIPPPTIGSFTPTSGPIATTVVISGTHFTGATAVQFNGVAAGFTVDSSTSITATVPSGATTGPIGVTTPGGTATSSSSFTVTASESTVTRIQDADPAITYTGAWIQGNTGHAWSGGTAALGFNFDHVAELSFSGTGVSWIGYRGPEAGIARVLLDGVLQATVDAYAAAAEVEAVMFAASGLTDGPHLLRIEVTGSKNPASTDRFVVVDAFDVTSAAGGTSPDSTPPSVAITSPASGATVAGTIRVTANASDNLTVDGVQFLRNGMPLGPEDTAAPYELTWDTTAAANGSHTLTAVARDGAGNTTTSAPVAVTVDNAPTSSTPTLTRYEDTETSIVYTPGTAAPGQPPAWFHGSRSRDWSDTTATFNRSAGARATFTFTGTSVSWIGFRAFWAGIANVYLDGALVAQVDLFLSKCPTPAPAGCVDQQAQAPVFTATGLAPGTHTLTVESTGTKNPDSEDYAVVVDAFDVGPGTPPTTWGTRVEQTPTVTYTAGWTPEDSSESSWSGATAAVTNAAGERATFTFIGTEMRWIGLRGPGTGIANVYLDGAFHARIDTHYPTDIQSVVFTITGLAPTRHTVIIEATGEKNASATDSVIVIDAFDIRSRYEEREPPVVYTGTWTRDHMDRNWSGTTGNAGSGTAAVSATAGAVAEFTFSGTAVTWIGFRGPTAGIADVLLDGSPVQTVDLYAPVDQLQVPVFTATNLPEGPHTLTVRVTGDRQAAATGALVVVDAFDATLPASVPAMTRVQQTAPSVAYIGSWENPGVNDLDSGGTITFSSTAGSRAEFTFTGTAVRWIGHRRRDGGIARVSIDGVPIGEIDLFVPIQDELQAAVFSAIDLAPGTHTLSIEVTGTKNASSSGYFIVVDAFDSH